MLKAFKLVRLKKDGTIGTLFIVRGQAMPFGEWLQAEENPTKGFAVRRGWHCTFTKHAPHLKKDLKSGEHRVWVEVEVEDYVTYERPESQGGAWILAEKMKIIRIVE